MAKTIIYALCDPITLEIKYVGQSTNPTARYKGHALDKSNVSKYNWFLELKNKNLRPLLVFLDSVRENASTMERFGLEKIYALKAIKEGNTIFNSVRFLNSDSSHRDAYANILLNQSL